ncbi:MAG TPA: hypothetical protein VMD08_12335 [Candidatus Baltobacteraceae bacterium]|nr:hypothetical protein [Candidatus Baltobacteraceae bacterium]
MKDCERRRTAPQDELPTLIANEPVVKVDLRQIQGELRKRLDGWRGLLTRQVAQARWVLRKLLIGRLTFTPKKDANGRNSKFSGQGMLGRLPGGIAFPGGKEDPMAFVQLTLAGLSVWRRSPRSSLSENLYRPIFLLPL